jgi:predicted hydrolase (HD superfamily)
MDRNAAYQLLTTLVKNPNLIKHHLAAEAVMKALYKRLAPQGNLQDEGKWGLVGLLHDADYELSKNHPEKHSLILEEKIGSQLSPDVLYAIKSHAFLYNGVSPKSQMDWAIYTCDELTGLIIASMLIHPDKKLASLTVDFVLNRFKELNFAKGANREQIKMCEAKLGIPLNEFIDISLKAMQQVSSQLEAR